MPQKREQSSLFLVFALTCLFSRAAWKSWAFQQAFPFVPYIFGFIALAGGFKTISLAIRRLYNFLLRRDAMADTGLKGTAHWADHYELKSSGLYKTDGLFLGRGLDGRPLFYDGETHGLTLALAGSGKTVAFTIPALCHSPLPIISVDYKGVTSVMTKALREKQHNQEVFNLNPAGL